MGRAVFKKGQKCLIPHTEIKEGNEPEVTRFYAALILKSQKRDDGHHYLVHYEGWGRKYDEWIEETGLVKYDKNLADQSVDEEVVAAAGGATTTAGGEEGGSEAPAAVQLAAAAAQAIQKRKADQAAEAAKHAELPMQLRLHIPALLKRAVLEDYEQVCGKGMMLPLPRKAHGRPTVADILADYRTANKDGENAEQAEEVVAGLRQYFDRGLRHYLLYSAEQPAAETALAGGAAPADVYGGEHLARLLVKLPELVPVAHMGLQNVLTLEARLADLMARMAEIKLLAKFFSTPGEYVQNPDAPPPAALPVLGLPPLAPGAPAAPGEQAAAPAEAPAPAAVEAAA